MKFSVNKKDMSDKLQYLNNVIPSKSNMMVLANFKIEAKCETNTITIVATDLNITTVVTIAANVMEDGSILVSAKHLADIIASLPDQVINFSIREETLVIECGNSNFSINFLESSLFPEISFIDSDNQYTFDADSFKKMIENSAFCTSTEAHQSIINGVYCKLEDNLMTFAGTDTRRIGEAKLKAEFTVEEPYEIVLPTRALNFLEKNIKDDVESISIKYDVRRISFHLSDIVLISNRYDGKFPTYTVAFRNQPNYSLLIDRNTLRDAIRRASLLSEDDDKLIKIALSESEIIVESHLSERGNAKESIKGFKYDGPDVLYCFNSRLFTGILNAIDTDDVVLKFRSPEEPIWILNNAVYENMDITFILMPMRLGR